MDHEPSAAETVMGGQLRSHRSLHGWFWGNDKRRIGADNLDVVPTDFPWDPLTNTYKITWGYVGDFDHRYLFFDEFAERPDGVASRLLSPGEEIPAGVVCVVTYLVRPLVYPDD